MTLRDSVTDHATATEAPETVSVRFIPGDLVPIRGNKRLAYVATVVIEISGIELRTQGWQIIRDGARLIVRAPQAKHPVTGAGVPVLPLPIELHRAIEAELLASVPGARVTTLARPDE